MLEREHIYRYVFLHQQRRTRRTRIVTNNVVDHLEQYNDGVMRVHVDNSFRWRGWTPDSPLTERVLYPLN